jgi:hydrogenase nickel incorporation protein HypA/HybF
MHERSLVRALLRQVQRISDEHSGSRVVSIHVRIGEFSGVDSELLASAYDDLSKDSPLCGAALELAQTPLEALCDLCGSHFRIDRFKFQCDQCGSLSLTIRGGEEMMLESVTMEESEP